MAAQISLQFSYLFNLWTIERFRDERTLRWTNQDECFPVAENFYLASLNRSKLRTFASRASPSALQWNRLSEMLQRSLLRPVGSNPTPSAIPGFSWRNGVGSLMPATRV